MLNNNLIREKKKIPQNEKSFFNIIKNQKYKKSIEIQIKHKEKVNFLNLFLILKSYCLNLEYLPVSFVITVFNEDNLFITYNQDIDFIRKMSYKKFLIWYENQYKEDEKYLNNKSIYSFNIMFVTEKEIEDLNPIYPWKNEIINFFWENLNEEINYEEIIKNKNIIIKKLNEDIKKMKKQIKKKKKLII